MIRGPHRTDKGLARLAALSPTIKAVSPGFRAVHPRSLVFRDFIRRHLRMKIDAKIEAPYLTTGKVMTVEDLNEVRGIYDNNEHR